MKTVAEKTCTQKKEVSKRFLDIMNDVKDCGKRAMKDIPVEKERAAIPLALADGLRRLQGINLVG